MDGAANVSTTTATSVTYGAHGERRWAGFVCLLCAKTFQGLEPQNWRELQAAEMDQPDYIEQMGALIREQQR